MKSYTCLFVAACAATTAEAAAPCATTVPVGKYVSAIGTGADCATTDIIFSDFLVAPEGSFYSTVGTVGTVSTTGGTEGTDAQNTVCATTEANKFLSGACVAGSVLEAGSNTAFTAYKTTADIPAGHYAVSGTATADVTFVPFTTDMSGAFDGVNGVPGTIAADGTVTDAADVDFSASLFTRTPPANKWASAAGVVGSVTAGVVTAGTDVAFTAFVAGPPANKFAATAGVPGGAATCGALTGGSATVFTAFTTSTTGAYGDAAGVPGVAAADGTLTAQGRDIGGAMCHVIALATEQTETAACVPGAAAADGTITTPGTDQTWTGCADVDPTKYTTVAGTGAQCATTQATTVACATSEANKFWSGACVPGSGLVVGQNTQFTAYTTTVPPNNYAVAGTWKSDVTFMPFTNTVPANHFAATNGAAGTVATDGTVTGAADVGFTAFTTTGWAGKWATTPGTAGSVTAAGVVTTGTDIIYTAAAAVTAGSFNSVAMDPGTANADGTITVGAVATETVCATVVAAGKYASASCVAGAMGAAGTDTAFGDFTVAVPAGSWAVSAGTAGTATAGTAAGGMDVAFAPCTAAIDGETTIDVACVTGAVAADGLSLTTDGADTTFTGCTQPAAGFMTDRIGAGVNCVTMQPTSAACSGAATDSWVSAVCVGGSGLVLGTDTASTAFTTAVADGFWISAAGSAGTATMLGSDVVTTAALAVPDGSYNSGPMAAGAANTDGTITAGNSNTVSECSAPRAGRYVDKLCVKYGVTTCPTDVATTVGQDTDDDRFSTDVPDGYWVSAAGVAGTATTLGSDVQFTKCTVPTADETVVADCVPGTVADDGSIATAGSNTVFPTAAPGASGAPAQSAVSCATALVVAAAMTLARK